MIRVNKWTLGLAAVGLVSLPAGVQAEEKKPNFVETAMSSTTISGYVNTSAHWNPGDNGVMPTYGFNNQDDKADGFNLDVVDIAIEKVLEPTDNWAAGYKVELFFGPDADAWAVASGSDTSSMIKQAYVDLQAPLGTGLKFRVGAFDTIVGYESFHAGNNPNYTRSYGFTIEPTEHTGVLMSYQFTKALGASAGIANTAYGPLGGTPGSRSGCAESDKAYMGSLTLTAPESMGFLAGSALYGGIVRGWGSITTGDSSSTADNNVNYYAGAIVNTPWKLLKVGAAYDYRGFSENSHDGPPDSGYMNAVSGYASFTLTENLSLHTRVEYATTTPSIAEAVSGLPEEVLAVTGTIDYNLWGKNVITRGEFRWDHSLDGDEYSGGGGTGVDTPNAYLLAANIIFKF